MGRHDRYGSKAPFWQPVGRFRFTPISRRDRRAIGMAQTCHDWTLNGALMRSVRNRRLPGFVECYLISAPEAVIPAFSTFNKYHKVTSCLYEPCRHVHHSIVQGTGGPPTKEDFLIMMRLSIRRKIMGIAVALIFLMAVTAVLSMVSVMQVGERLEELDSKLHSGLWRSGASEYPFGGTRYWRCVAW